MHMKPDGFVDRDLWLTQFSRLNQASRVSGVFGTGAPLGRMQVESDSNRSFWSKLSVSSVRRLVGMRRVSRSAGELLTVHKIATIPSFAVIFLSACFSVMLYFAARYQINVVYGLAFFGFVMQGVAAWGSFRVLHGLALSVKSEAKPCHAGESMSFALDIEETQGRKRQNIIVHVGEKQYEIAIDPKAKITLCFEVPALARGILQAPLVKISTPYPIGIWNTHHLWLPSQSGAVFPAIEPHAPAIAGGKKSEDQASAGARLSNEGDSLVALRAYAAGDSMRRVAWRLYAKTDGQVLATKQGEVGSACMEDLWVQEQAAAELANPEHRLSRLAAWLHQAHESGRPYGMSAAGCKIDPATGDDHLRQCLMSLAMASGYATRVGFERLGKL